MSGTTTRKLNPDSALATTLKAVVAIVATVGLASCTAVMIVTAYAKADHHRQAVSAVQALTGMSYGTFSTTNAAVGGAPLTTVSGEHDRIKDILPRFVARLRRLSPHSREAAAFLDKFDSYHEAATEQWEAVKEHGPRVAEALDGIARARFAQLFPAANAAQEVLESSARGGVQSANVTAVAALLSLSMLSLVLLTRIGRVRRRNAVREIQERALRESEQRFRSLVHRATDMITVLDVDGTILYDSPAVERILGWNAGERFGRSAREFAHPDDVKGSGPSETPQREVRVQSADGMWHWVEATIADMLDEPSVAGYVCNYRVIDERKALEAQLTHRAMHDTLTNLANRALFRDRVEVALRRRDLGVRRPSVMFIDVDDFKTINDGFGHDVGDQLLIEVAKRLSECVRPEDVVARLGGDEFAILTEEGPSSDGVAVGIAERIIGEMRAPLVVGGRHLFIQGSIGIASYRSGAPDADALLRQADTAMYTAKAQGKARYEIFSETMHELIRRRVDLESELRAGIEGNEMVVNYQPIVSLESGVIDGAEALIRWDHPTRGLLPPSEFLPVAEETGLIVPIGRKLLNEACLQVKAWRDRSSTSASMRVSVNLSSIELRSESLVDDVAGAIARAGIPADALIIEVTESVLTHEIERVADVLDELVSLGVLIAIDDFGTGYSSLSHLKRFPVNILKIDKSFVDCIAAGPEESALARAILKLGHEFSLKTVAEGIEDTSQDVELRRLGCSYGQGYYYSRPVAASVIDDLLSTDDLAAALQAGPADRSAVAG